MDTGIKDILIITTELDHNRFKMLFGDGSYLGINIQYKIQKRPNGIAEAFLLAENFLEDSPCVLILGDNIFYGNDFSLRLLRVSKINEISTVFAYPVKNPCEYGIIELNKENKILSIEEKPSKPKSKNAITGLYFYDNNVVNVAKSLKPSDRGELEITDLNRVYLENNLLNVEMMGRGDTWLDAGTNKSFMDASHFVQTIENRQGLKIACIEEIAWKKGWINDDKLKNLALKLLPSDYGKYLIKVLNEKEINEIS